MNPFRQVCAYCGKKLLAKHLDGDLWFCNQFCKILFKVKAWRDG